VLCKLKIRTRIYSGYGAIVALGLGIGGFSVFQLSTVTHQVRTMGALSANVSRIAWATVDLEAIRRAEARYRLDGHEGSLNELKDRESQARTLLTEAARTTLSEDQRRDYNRVLEALQIHSDTVDQYVQMTKTVAIERAKLLTGGDELTAASSRLLAAAAASPGSVIDIAAEKLNGAILLARVASWHDLATDDRGDIATFKSNLETANVALTKVEQLSGPAVRALSASVHGALSDYASAFNATSEAHLKSIDVFEIRLRPQIIFMQKQLALTATSLKEGLANANATDATSNLLSSISLIQVIMAATTLVVGGTLALLIGRSIVRPLAAMTGAMTYLATGNNSVDIPSRDNTDELGDMARAVELLKNSMIKADHFVAGQLREQAVRERRTVQVNGLVRGFETKVSVMVGILSSGAAELEATARAMAGTATRTNAQAVTLAAPVEASVGVSSVASVAEELTASISEISCQVAQSSRITARAVSDAERTDVIVRALAEGAERIEHVVGLITNIAGQTNLLALHPTIEAARAGDAGNRVAAVASEVKNLANQTATVTEEIGAQIAQIQAATKAAVDAIRGITGTIEEVSSISMRIAAAVEEQGAARAEIARDMQQTTQSGHDVTTHIVGITRLAATETGEAAAQVLRAAGALSRQAEQLTCEVGSFTADVRAA
jgi:methyl-accepting chemotaxis protein